MLFFLHNSLAEPFLFAKNALLLHKLLAFIIEFTTLLSFTLIYFELYFSGLHGLQQEQACPELQVHLQ